MGYGYQPLRATLYKGISVNPSVKVNRLVIGYHLAEFGQVTVIGNRL
jgi:hypothetical protein